MTSEPCAKHIKGFDPRNKNDDWVTIIGVVNDVHCQGLERGPMAQIFEAQSQSLPGAPPALQSRWSPSPSPYLANVRVGDNPLGTAYWHIKP